MKFTVILEPEAEGGYSVICPAIPGCVSQGDSLDEALANIREAILLCLEVQREDEIPLPVETPEMIAREIQECLQDRAEEGLALTIETREVAVDAEVDDSAMEGLRRIRENREAILRKSGVQPPGADMIRQVRERRMTRF